MIDIPSAESANRISSDPASTETSISLEELIKKIQSGHSLAAAAGLSKNHLEAIYSHGFFFFTQGKYAQALDIFALLLTFEQADRRFFLAAGTCLQLLNAYEKAIDYLAIANIFEPTDPKPAVQIAECLLAMKRYSDAYRLLKTIAADFDSLPEHKELILRINALISLGEK
jgi:type III secretion system low calcium response chaperone LcrH/SycD